MGPLDPGIQAYLQRIRDTVGIHPKPNSIEDRRRNTERTHSVWQKSAPDTIEVMNWWVVLPGREIPIRIYRRRGVTDPGIVLYIHGGGFVASSYDTHDTITWSLAEATGAIVVSVHYRRAPENPFPAAQDDCFEVLQWIRRHGDWLAADTDRLAVVGDSAGGCLATALAMQVRDRGCAPVRLQALLYPCVDPSKGRASHKQAADPMLTAEMMDYFWDAYLPGQRDTSDPLAAPIRSKQLAGLAPAFVAVGDHDPLHDETVEYAAMLEQAGVPTELRVGRGLVHGFLRARFASEASQAEFDALAAAIVKALR
jgi:acetyl esterase